MSACNLLSSFSCHIGRYRVCSMLSSSSRLSGQSVFSFMRSSARVAAPLWLVASGDLFISQAQAAPAGVPLPPQLPYNAGQAARQAEMADQPPLPPPAAVPVLPRVVEPELELPDKETLMVRHIVVEGVEPAEQKSVAGFLSSYKGKNLTLAQIYDAAGKLTAYYRGQGFLVAKVHVPAQDARDGTLRFKLVRGRFGQATIQNESLVSRSFLQGVIDEALAGRPAITEGDLERAMLLVSDLHGAGMPHSAIAPGLQAGSSDFVFTVPHSRRVDGYLLSDNVGSRYTGRWRMNGGVNINSPAGIGDRISLFGIISTNSNLINGRASYSAPIGHSGLRGEIGAYKTDYALGGAYSSLDAVGYVNSIYGTLSYPILRARAESLYVSATYSHRNLNDQVFGVSTAHRSIDTGTISFNNVTYGTLGSMPLTSDVFASYTEGYVRFADQEQLQANRETLGTAGHYRRINLSVDATLGLMRQLALMFHFNGQKSLSGSMDSSEQMTLSGLWGVRSYYQGLSADSGFLFMPELRYSLPQVSILSKYQHSLGVFTDIAGGWLHNASVSYVQRHFSEVNDIGVGYYATYEYLPGRYVTAKGMFAHTYGSDYGLSSYNLGTTGLMQVGLTF